MSALFLLLNNFFFLRLLLLIYGKYLFLSNLFHLDSHRFVSGSFFFKISVVSGGCTVSAAFREAVGVGALALS